jgi:glutamyl-tRNA synthetase
LKNSKVVTRIAPSPTGNGASSCHAGLGRTALFNWAYARKNGGKFILRIEDTDQKRSTKESEDGIINDLKWLGIDWDEGPDIGGKNGPYRQSERLDLYNPFIEKLLKDGNAYEDDGCVRIKFKHYGKTHCDVDDMILGKVSYPNNLLQDFVIRKSDGFPTYHFGVVVDDAMMGINHIFRAQEHLANTPKHILIQKALGFDIPNYAHMPIILNQDGSKMSKRQKTGEINISDFRESGYISSALINYLSMLGWSPKTKEEIFNKKFLVDNFDIKDVRKSNAKFDYKKLQNVNGKHLSLLDEKEFVTKATDYISYIENHQEFNISAFHKKAQTFGQISNSISMLKEVVSNNIEVEIQQELIQSINDMLIEFKKAKEWNQSSVMDIIKKTSEKNLVSIGAISNTIKQMFRDDKTLSVDLILTAIGKDKSVILIDNALKSKV